MNKGCTKEQTEAQLCGARMGRGMCQVLFQLLYQSAPIPSTPAPPKAWLSRDQREAVATAGFAHC